MQNVPQTCMSQYDSSLHPCIEFKQVESDELAQLLPSRCTVEQICCGLNDIVDQKPVRCITLNVFYAIGFPPL